MSIAGKLVIAALVGALAAIAMIFVIGENPSPLSLAVAFLAATIITVLATHKPLANPETAYQGAARAQPAPRKTKPKPKPAAGAAAPAPVSTDAARQEGEVKWFNASKGFGFITVDGGEEVFVHFRSIRGEGRRALNDGQRVSFVVAQTDKGPQAEDVEAQDQG